MDPILVKGLREAKQLLDDGILSPAEFEKEKTVLLQKRDVRVQREQLRAREDPERRYRSDGANNTFCSRCGLPGHNKRSCTEDLEAMGGKKRRRKSKFNDINGKRGPAKPRWSREPTCYALFFGSGAGCSSCSHCCCLQGCPRARYSRALFSDKGPCLAELKKMKAEDGDKKLKISDAAKVVAAKWKTMTEEDKLKWKRERAAGEGEGSTGVVLGITGVGPMGGMAGVGGSQSAMSAAHPHPPAASGESAVIPPPPAVIPPPPANNVVPVQPPPPAK